MESKIALIKPCGSEVGIEIEYRFDVMMRFCARAVSLELVEFDLL